MRISFFVLGVLTFVKGAYSVEDECNDEGKKCIALVTQALFGGGNVHCKFQLDAKNCLLRHAGKYMDEGKKEVHERIDEMFKRVNPGCPSDDDEGHQKGPDDDEEHQHGPGDNEEHQHGPGDEEHRHGPGDDEEHQHGPGDDDHNKDVSNDDDDEDAVTEEEKNMVQCLEKQQGFLISYVWKCRVNMKENSKSIPRLLGAEPSDVDCRTFLSISRCVASKAAELCGAFVEKPVVQGMMMAFEQQHPITVQSPECVEVRKVLDEEEVKHSKRTRRHLASFQFLN